MKEEEQPPKRNKPWIVCAANRHRTFNDEIICGARHWDMVMRSQLDPGEKIKGSEWEQGFIDQFGTWYNRTDAMKAVKESGQPFNAERNGHDDDVLFSEGLY